MKPAPVDQDTSSRSVADVACLVCGCLCDDLKVTSENGKIVEIGSACQTGREWFLAADAREPVPNASIEGNPVDTDEAIERAAVILAHAKAPVIWGLSKSATETARAAVELADVLGGRVVLDRPGADLGRVAAFQEQGRVSATLGEVRNRADLVVFWGADPLSTHPRHWERYSVEPKGRFVPEGRAGRTVVVVGDTRTASAERADASFRIAPGRHVEAFSAMRLFLRGGNRVDATRPRGQEGLDSHDLATLTTRMKSARDGALFYQPADGSGAGWEGAARLVRDLNDFTRFVLLGMGAGGNLAGAEAAMTWQGGYAQGVDYRLGCPKALDDRRKLEEILSRGEADAIVCVGPALPEGLSDDARTHLGTIPTVRIGTRATEAGNATVAVALASTTPGLDAEGTVTRTDGVVLPLRPVKGSELPDASELIRAVIVRLRKGGRGVAS